jgi:hypothetical protein
MQVFRVERVLAVFAVPQKTVLFFRSPLTLYDEADGVCEPLWRMRNSRGQQEDLALTDGYIDLTAVLHGPQDHVAFELIEELLAGVIVEVAPRIGAADHHDDEFRIAKYLAIAHGRLEELAMFLDPLTEVERFAYAHVSLQDLSISFATLPSTPVAELHEAEGAEMR